MCLAVHMHMKRQDGIRFLLDIDMETRVPIAADLEGKALLSALPVKQRDVTGFAQNRVRIFAERFVVTDVHGGKSAKQLQRFIHLRVDIVIEIGLRKLYFHVGRDAHLINGAAKRGEPLCDRNLKG